MKARVLKNNNNIAISTQKSIFCDMDKINIFMEHIHNKTNYNFFKLIPYWIHKRRINSFINKIYKGSPSFDTLWQMADFIKIAEAVFCYDNSIDNTDIGLYSSKNYNDDTNGFKITCPDCIITIKLFSNSKRVALEIEHLNGEKMRTSISFKNEQWEYQPTVYDEMILEQVIKSINRKILELFKYCYELA